MKPEPSELQRRQFLISAASGLGGALVSPAISVAAVAQEENPEGFVSLKEAHIGTLEIDLRIMNQFGELPQEELDFYKACRVAINGNDPDRDVAEVCQTFQRSKLGGPMLGDIGTTSVAVWMHLPKPSVVQVIVTPQEKGGSGKTFVSDGQTRIFSVHCSGLSPNTAYSYRVVGSDETELGQGKFTTPPRELSKKPFRIAFGADFHKIGMYRPELMQLIQSRGSLAMLLIGDSAVDGRGNDLKLINTDYMLRNLSPPLQKMTANVPVSATWDDHDYWGNDISGDRAKKKQIDVDGLRKAWKTQWNNPQRDVERAGIYFQTNIGPVHYIALDTRSCRIRDQRGKLNSFLGPAQMDWLKQQIAESTSPFIIISGGTMWTDYISAGKDSWGTWDTEGREEIFQVIDQKKDSQVLLLSGDRHGARGFKIPRPGANTIYEFEIGTLGGVPGPDAFGDDRTNQLFGLPSRSWAYGEFVFSKHNDQPQVEFHLISEQGKILETVTIPS